MVTLALAIATQESRSKTIVRTDLGMLKRKLIKTSPFTAEIRSTLKITVIGMLHWK